MQQVSKNVYVETGFRGCNVSFVVTSEGVVVIDTPQMPADAVAWRREIAKHGEVRYVIITEPHGDHFSGAHFYGGTMIAHEGTREAIQAAKAEAFIERVKQNSPASVPFLEGFRFRLPDITLSQRLTLHVGKHTFKLTSLPGHTPYQVPVHVPEERVVFTSDNVFGKAQPWLTQAVPYEWLESLKAIEKMGNNTLVPGHGVVCQTAYLAEMSAFIKDWIDAVHAAIDKGLTLEEAKKKISFLDRCPVEPGGEAAARQVEAGNIARLYEVLKK